MDWTVIGDDALKNEFVRVYSNTLGRPVEPADLRIEQTDDAVRIRISYAGAVIETTDPDGEQLDQFETVTSAARTLAYSERDNDYH